MNTSNQNSNNKQNLPDNEELLRYINEELPKDQEWELEQKMGTNPLLRDAEEGLQLMKNKKDLSLLIQDINKKMGAQLAKKQKQKKAPNTLFLLVMSALLLLLLVAFFLVFIYQKTKS